MHRITLFLSLACFNSFAYSQLLGKVNGRDCIEVKDSRGCCQVAQTNDGYGHSIIECPWTEPAYVCKKSGMCLVGITESCKAGWGEVKRLDKKDVACKQPYWTTFTEERKKGIRKMNEWCASQGGVLITPSNYPCECVIGDITNHPLIKSACKDYKRFEENNK